MSPKAVRAAALFGGIAVVALIATAVLYAEKRQAVVSSGGLAFYTTDDGKTWFTGAGGQHPPFDTGGKVTLGASVWSCGGKQFVGFVDRYTPEAVNAVREFEKKAATAKSDPGPGPYQWVALRGREVKRPGDTDWTRCDSGKAEAIMHPKAPAGESGPVTPVDPNG